MERKRVWLVISAPTLHPSVPLTKKCTLKGSRELPGVAFFKLALDLKDSIKGPVGVLVNPEP